MKGGNMDTKYLRIRRSGDVLQCSVYSDENRKSLEGKFKIKVPKAG